MFNLKRSSDIKPLSTSVINKGYIPFVENSYNLIVGEGGTYKSFYALKSAVIYLLDNKSKNAFLALKEDGINECIRRLKMVCENMNIDYNIVNQRIFWHTVEEDNLMFVQKTSQAILNNQLLNDFIQSMIINDVGFIVLDTLKRMHQGLKENDSTDMQLLINGVFNKIPSSAGATLLVVHHSSKGEGSAVRGSSSISDDSRLTWALSRDVVKNKMTGKTEKDENAAKIKLTLHKENGTASRECKIRDKDGYIDLPFSTGYEISYQDKNGRYTSPPTVTEYKEDNTPLNQTETYQEQKVIENLNPTITLSHKMAKEDYDATKDFKVIKLSLEDFVDMNANIDWHYSSIQWIDGYRKTDNYKSYEDVLIYDFDDGMTIDEAVSRFKNYNAVIMPTKSHQIDKKGLVCDRFRVVIPFSTPMIKDAEMSKLIKTEIYKECGADLQVASASTKFRGSPMKHNPIFTNGSNLFEWEKYEKLVLLNIENEKRAKEQKRMIRESNNYDSNDDFSASVEDVKARLTREVVADIINSQGYEVNRQFKFKYREDEKTASASISSDLLIKDFGDDSLCGDVFHFMMVSKNVDFKTALSIVGDYVGIRSEVYKCNDNLNMAVL